MARIVVLDDDFAAEALVDYLASRGHSAERIAVLGSSQETVDRLSKADLVVIDVILQRPSDLSEAAARGGHRTGFLLAQRLRAAEPSIPIVGFSATQDGEVQDWFRTSPNAAFINKLNFHGIDDVTRRIEAFLTSPRRPPMPRVFIVHGHDETAKLSLKNYLQNVLQFPEPIVLHEQPSQGRGLMEKLEHYGAQVELVFVLLSPDDGLVEAAAGNPDKRRARQNVIFELGYFLGTLKRSSGRVLLLHKGPLDLPSDLSGLVYIDISSGIEAASETIRRELRDVIE